MLKGPVGSLFFSITVMLLLVAGLAYASVRITSPQKSQDRVQYAAIFDPHQLHADVFNAILNAGGYPVRSGTFDFIQIVASSSPDFKQDLYDQGALFVFRPIIGGACYIQNKSRMSAQRFNTIKGQNNT